MSRKDNPELLSKKTLDKAVGHLIRRRGWRGDWQLFDSGNRNRPVSWGAFHDRPNTQIEAVTAVRLNGKQWWITAHYEISGDVGWLVLFGLLGAMMLKNKLNLQFCDVDPRTLNKPTWDYLNHPDGHVRKYISSRDELKTFLAEQ